MVQEAPAVVRESFQILADHDLLRRIRPEDVNLIVGQNYNHGECINDKEGLPHVFVSLDLIASAHSESPKNLRDVLKMTLLHELSHAIHPITDKVLENPMMERLWSEGMAVYVSRVLAPSLISYSCSNSHSRDLENSGAFKNFIDPFLHDASEHAELHRFFSPGVTVSSSDHPTDALLLRKAKFESKWFGITSNQPPYIGYSIGAKAVERLAKSYDLKEMMSWGFDRAIPEVQKTLDEFKKELKKSQRTELRWVAESNVEFSKEPVGEEGAHEVRYATSPGIDLSGGVLFAAVKNGNLEETRRLLQGGCDPNSVNFWHETPLHLSTELGNEAITTVLLDFGASPHVEAVAGATPLLIAKEWGYTAILELLQERGGIALTDR